MYRIVSYLLVGYGVDWFVEETIMKLWTGWKSIIELDTHWLEFPLSTLPIFPGVVHHELANINTIVKSNECM